MLESLLAGFINFGWQNGVMLIIGCVLIALAIKKEYEPLLLLPIGFGCILANIPLSGAISTMVNGVEEPGFLTILYDMGIANELFPILIFIGIGAMIDFTPLLTQPVTLFYGAAAQFGIFAAFLMAVCVNFIAPGTFSLHEAAAVGIIGAADGPTSIFVGNLFAPNYIAPITVAAYSYMSLVPVIQPPVIRALTTKKERMIRMEYQEKQISKTLKILFPIVVTIVAGVVAPVSTALIGSLMLGNLLKECAVTDRLSDTAQKELNSIVTLLMGIAIGSSMKGADFLTPQTALIMGIGLLAFVFDTAGGVLFAKLINLFLKKKINPMVGACGISAFPMSARIIQKMAQKEDSGNFILMQAIGANVSGQVGSVIAGSVMIAVLSSIVL